MSKDGGGYGDSKGDRDGSKIRELETMLKQGKQVRDADNVYIKKLEAINQIAVEALESIEGETMAGNRYAREALAEISKLRVPKESKS